MVDHDCEYLVNGVSCNSPEGAVFCECGDYKACEYFSEFQKEDELEKNASKFPEYLAVKELTKLLKKGRKFNPRNLDSRIIF